MGVLLQVKRHHTGVCYKYSIIRPEHCYRYSVVTPVNTYC